VFYGLGDKPGSLQLRGKRLENFGTDAYAYGADTDPLYKNIPFYYGLHHGQAYGIFFDNTFRTLFDFGAERQEATSFWARGGEMNYYFIYGPEMVEVAEEYANLTGQARIAAAVGFGVSPVPLELFSRHKGEGGWPLSSANAVSLRCYVPRYRLHGRFSLLYLF
jgi:alpha-glucosidase (family GH31 glycosyl hydrolase)